MSSFGVIAIGRNVRVGIMVKKDYPIMCADCCRFHEKYETYCRLFEKKLVKIEDCYARVADCIKGDTQE
jgi:hypothetical protein